MTSSCYLTQQKHNYLSDDTLAVKCPCCRKLKNELVCGPCCSNKVLKLNGIRDRRRALFLNKAQLSLAIEKHLENEVLS